MNESIEIHDSTLAGIEIRPIGLVLKLRPAYIHRSEGRPGWDAGSSWTQDLDLIISDATFDPTVPISGARLGDGILSIDAMSWSNCFPLPLSAPGPVLLRLMTDRGDWIEIRGDDISARLRGEAEYCDEFPGADEP